MKKISKIQASKRILAIAKNVALVQASNNKLTPLEIAKVQKTVGMILAAADIDQETLKAIQSLDDVPNGNKTLTQFQKEKGNIDFNANFKITPQIKNFLRQNHLVIKTVGNVKVKALLAILKQLVDKFYSRVDETNDQSFEEQTQQELQK